MAPVTPTKVAIRGVDGTEVITHQVVPRNARGVGPALNKQPATIVKARESGIAFGKSIDDKAARQAQALQILMQSAKATKYDDVANSCVTHVFKILKEAGINADKLWGKKYHQMDLVKEILKELGFIEL